VFYSTNQKPSVVISIAKAIPRPDRFLSRDRLEKHGRIDRVDPVMDDHRSDKRLLRGFFFPLARRWRD
jgi:hypothetical protein